MFHEMNSILVIVKVLLEARRSGSYNYRRITDGSRIGSVEKPRLGLQYLFSIEMADLIPRRK